MYPHGIVYQSGKGSSHSEFILRPKPLVKLTYHLLRVFGFGFIAFAITGILFTFWPITKEEFNYRFHKPQPVADNGFGELIAKALAQKRADMVREEAQDLGLDPYFSLYIPKTDAKADIIANVDAGNFEEYSQALKKGVAHARGTNFPGQGKTVYLFSHSTDSPLNFSRYNAIFYLLGKLEAGDRVTVYFLNQKFIYQVTEKLITQADDTSWLTDNGQGERLVLQTCDPPGTSLRRLIVIAVPIDTAQ